MISRRLGAIRVRLYGLSAPGDPAAMTRPNATVNMILAIISRRPTMIKAQILACVAVIDSAQLMTIGQLCAAASAVPVGQQFSLVRLGTDAEYTPPAPLRLPPSVTTSRH
jgi:hypothetical protein